MTPSARASGVLVGIDVGTSSAKAAAFDPTGRVVARVRLAMPPLLRRRGGVVQSAREVRAAANGALEALEAECGGWSRIALTCQRDTFLLVDRRGRPATDLVSWRDQRAASGRPLVDLLLDELDVRDGPGGAGPGGSDDGTALRARSLASWLTEVWTGRAAETSATWPRHLSGESRERVVDRLGVEALPDEVPVGGVAGERNGAPLHPTSGDKNCELLAAGATGERAGLSLGSAISLGVAAAGEIRARPGIVVSPAAVAGRHDVETGLAVGVDGGERIARLVGLPPTRPPDPAWRTVPLCVPWLGRALDGAGEGLTFEGVAEHTTPADLHQAWAQGVVAELARLRPSLERAAGTEVREIVLYGGAAGGGWPDLVAGGTDLPVRPIDDPWLGARGAVLSSLLRNDAAAAGAFDEGYGDGELPAVTADGGSADVARAWIDAYLELVEALRSTH